MGEVAGRERVLDGLGGELGAGGEVARRPGDDGLPVGAHLGVEHVEAGREAGGREHAGQVGEAGDLHGLTR